MSAPKITVRRIWNALGPELTTGGADETRAVSQPISQAGAQFGFALTSTRARASAGRSAFRSA